MGGLGLGLFGVDVLVGEGLWMIDLNYFPSYAGVGGWAGMVEEVVLRW